MSAEANTFPTEDGNFARFEWGTIQNRRRTEEAGRPMFDKVLRVFIFSPGMNRSEVAHVIERYEDGDDPVQRRDDIIQRLGKAYRMFKDTADSGNRTGTPLEMWPALDVRQIASLKALNIYTVEALADLSDSALQQVGMGARDLKTRAQAFLDAASGTADVQQLAADNKRLTDQLAALQAKLDQMEADKPKRGRPRKDEAKNGKTQKPEPANAEA